MEYQREDGTKIEFTTILEDKEKATVFIGFKDSSKEYKIVDLAKHSETEEGLVIYQAQYGEKGTWARPVDMFFSKTDKNKYPDAKQEYRFEIKE